MPSLRIKAIQMYMLFGRSRFFRFVCLLNIALVMYIISATELSDWLASRSYWLNNDHLAPFDYIRLLRDESINWFQITHSRIPSIWPEIPLAALSNQITSNPLDAFATYLFLKPALTICLTLAMLYCIFGKKDSWALLIPFLIQYLITLVLPWYKDILSLSAYPIRHGGNLDNVLLFCGFAIYCFKNVAPRYKNKKSIFTAFFGLSLIASFSNRLFLVQALWPSLATYLILHFAFRTSANKHKLLGQFVGQFLLTTLSAGFLGYIAYILSIHQCSDVASSLRLRDFSVYGPKFWELLWQPVSFCLLAGIAFSMISIGRIFRKNSSFQQQTQIEYEIYLLFIGISTLTTSSLYLFFLPESLLDKNMWRYLIVPSAFMPIALSLIVVSMIKRQSDVIQLAEDKLHKKEKSLNYALSTFSVMSMVLVALLTKSFIIKVSQSYEKFYAGQTDWLNKTLLENNLNAKLGFVADPPWESRRLYALSNGFVNALSVSSDGNPLIFPHSRYEYLKLSSRQKAAAPESSDVVTPDWILASPKDFERMQAFYGKPVKQLDCYESKGCLYIFTKNRIASNTARFLSTWQDDRYRCLTKTLSRAKKLFLPNP